MLYREKIHSYIQSHKSKIVSLLKELIEIPSINGEARENSPYGTECSRALDFLQMIFKENSFETELDCQGGYLLSYYGCGKKSLGLFAHADVVPVSDDWLLTNPFEPIEKDGFLIGRGVRDDKSAIIISLYCAKILKELNIPFNSRLIMFTGSNEESGMLDVKNYVSKHTPPDFSLVVDTAFPLYRGNKGMLLFTSVCSVPILKILDITASNSKGAILGKIKLTFEYEIELYEYLKANESERISVCIENHKIVVEACGISKHTALPEGSLNAGYLIFDLLSKYSGLSEENRLQLEFISKLLSNYYGEAIGIENNDADFGRLTFVNDIVNFENGKIKLHFNLRFGAAIKLEELKEKINKAFSDKGWEIKFEMDSSAKIIDISNPMIQTCLKTYKKFTGDTDAPVYVNAGGTYARYLPCAAEIGTTLRGGAPNGLPQGHGEVHQPDECISIDGLLDAIELTALMLLECDKANCELL